MPQLPPAYPINSKTSGIAPKIGNHSSVAPRIGGNPGVSAPKFSPPGSSFPGALPPNRSASLPSIPQNRSISPKYPPVYPRSSVQQTSEPDFPSTTIVQEYNDYIDDDMDDDDDTKTEQFELDQLEMDASQTTESDPIEFEEITNCELPAYEEKTNCEIPAFVFEDDADDNISFNEINERTDSDLPAYGDKTNVELNAQTTQLPVGALVNGRYAILGVIGSGGFATVYLARDITNNRNIALKAMDFQKSDDPNYSERLFREAKIAAKIKHPNVVSIFDFGHIKGNGQPFIAMELLKGHTLSKELIESGPLSPRRAFRLFSPVLDALAVGHRLGIVHKDLKPENL